jgi:hypothetical protein
METTKIMDAHRTCEVCGNVGHSGNDCLETREEASFINNGNNIRFRNNNFNNQGWNSRPNFPFNNQKAINKAKGERKTEIKDTPAKASPTSSPPKTTKKVWRVKRASSEFSTLGSDTPKII